MLPYLLTILVATVGGADSESVTILAVLFGIGIVLVTVFVDAPIRGYFGLHCWYMMLFNVILSPVRFALQIFTIVTLHKTYSHDRDYGERGDYYPSFVGRFVYVALGVKFVQVYKSKKIKTSKPAKSTKPAPAKSSAPSPFAVQVAERRKQYNAVQGTKSPSLYIDGILSFDKTSKPFNYYDGQFSSLYTTTQTAHISSLKINGLQYCYFFDEYKNYSAPLGICLKPGFYTIEITYDLIIFPPVAGLSSIKPCKYEERKKKISNVNIDGKNPVYIQLNPALDFYWTQDLDSEGIAVYDKDSTWNLTSKLLVVGEGEFNKYHPSWRSDLLVLHSDNVKKSK